MSAAERAKVMRLAAQGLGIHDIARALSRSSGPVRAVLRGQYNPRRRLVSEEEALQMPAWAAKGKDRPRYRRAALDGLLRQSE